MPFVENQGAKIYWDEQGEGTPVLLIMGLGYTLVMWHRTRPLLAQHFRTVAFDNRGVGLSDVPPGPYSIATMASDAAAILDAVGVSSAHVFGVSMGGMIAQEFALQYPARTRSLILGCTSPGGPSSIRADSNVIDVLLMRGMTPEQACDAILSHIYDAARRETKSSKMSVSASPGSLPRKATWPNCKASWHGRPAAESLRSRPRIARCWDRLAFEIDNCFWRSAAA